MFIGAGSRSERPSAPATARPPGEHQPLTAGHLGRSILPRLLAAAPRCSHPCRQACRAEGAPLKPWGKVSQTAPLLPCASLHRVTRVPFRRPGAECPDDGHCPGHWLRTAPPNWRPPPRALALGLELAATGLARRPYDLRHAALSLWLSAGAPPAEVAARAGHSVTVLLSVYAHCIDGQDRITNQLIEHALRPGSSAPGPKASGSADRRYPPRTLSAYVRERPPRPGHGPQSPGPASLNRRIPPPHPPVVSPVQTAYESLAPSGCGAPDLAHAWPTNQSKRSAEPLALHAKAGDAIPPHRL